MIEALRNTQQVLRPTTAANRRQRRANNREPLHAADLPQSDRPNRRRPPASYRFRQRKLDGRENLGIYDPNRFDNSQMNRTDRYGSVRLKEAGPGFK